METQEFNNSNSFNNSGGYSRRMGPGGRFNRPPNANRPNRHYDNAAASPETGANGSTEDYTRLTPLGFEHPVKSAILARFKSDLQLPTHASGMSAFGDIWVDALLPPVSLSPLTEEEVAAVASGAFTAVTKRPVPGAGRGGSQSIRGGGRGGRRGGHHNQSWSNDRDASYGSSLDQSGQVARGGRDLSDMDENAGDDEEVLWATATPSMDTSLGCFDDKGNFTMMDPSLMRRDPLSGVGGFFGSIPTSFPAQPPGLPAVPVPASPPQPVVSEVRWFYRDPAGQVQGPFNSKRMLHWYSRKYFPETLPLRREEDLLFEPLSAWKIKCGGVCPFELYLGQDDMPPMSGLSLSGTAQSTTATASTLKLDLEPKVAPKAPVVEKEEVEETLPNSTASILAKLGLPWQGPAVPAPAPVPVPVAPVSPPKEKAVKQLAEDQLRFFEQLNKKSSSSTATSPVTPQEEQQQESAANSGTASVASPWRQFERNSIDVEQELLKLKQTAPVAAPVTPSAPVAPAAQPATQAASVKLPAPKQMVSPLELTPAAAPAVGWAKPTAQAKPLDEILREEAEAEAAKRAISGKPVNGSSGPRSFAELVKAPGGQQPIVSPQSPPPMAAVKTTTTTTSASVAKAAASTASTAVKKPTTVASTPGAGEDLKTWCLNQLKPLTGTFDINMCTLLLLELRTPTEVASFIEDNMKSTKVDMAAFTREFVQRKFATTVPNLDGDDGADDEFVTVHNRRPRKK